MKWTREQEAVIKSNKENLLVSAAAGSGKTAVLTARLMEKLTDPKDPADIDEFLVLTFTKAAAAEMKSRIAQKIVERLAQDAGNTHLQRQLTLLSRAKITTIDGFCSWVVRSYGAINDLDMGFRVADTGEVRLLKRDVIHQVLEDSYAVKDKSFRESFEAFIETFAAGKTESTVEELIERTFDNVMSDPYPEAFLEKCRANDRMSSAEELFKLPWMDLYWERADFLIEEGLRLLKEADRLQAVPGAPVKYVLQMDSYRRYFEGVKAHERQYGALFELTETFKEDGAGARIKKGESKELDEALGNVRTALKKIVTSLQDEIFLFGPEIAYNNQAASFGPVNMLLFLTENFMQAFAEAKRRKNIVDFNDLEHFALNILRNGKERTAAAREIADSFREVMVDEYQDSNFLQEAILTAVSHVEDGIDNYFCVGDVKQSIYRFRQARPDLFIEKYNAYASGEKGHRIDLHDNFRSRPEMLEGVNAVFFSCMRKEVGGIDYDDAAALHSGNTDDMLINGSGQADHLVEIDLVDAVISKEDKKSIADEDLEDLKKKRLEARMTADKIRSMVGTYKIRNKEGEERPLHYGDIVILIRSLNDWGSVFKKTLEEQNIPCVAEQKKGFFDAYEVQLVLNLLSVLDNERQDLPFVSLMTSTAAGFTGEELALIRGNVCGTEQSEALCFAEQVRAYAETGEEESLRIRLSHFLEKLENYRQRAVFTPIHELIGEILDETGFEAYAASLPGGERRLANLKALREKAAAYEETSYVGLFNFVRYINTLKKYDQDPEVSGVGDSADAVKIMTIHGSKGLQFPVVFLCGTGKKFNQKDLTQTVLIDPIYGLASDYVDYKQRVKMTTLKKEAIRHRLKKESVGEELRVLYVAMTRAKLKLIVTGSYDSGDPMAKAGEISLENGRMPSSAITDAVCYMDVILPSVAAHENDPSPVFELNIRKIDSFIADEEEKLENTRKGIDYLEQLMNDQTSDPVMRKALEERFSFRYPYEGQCDTPVKVSVSEVKHERIQDLDGAEVYRDEDVMPFIPDFMKEKEERGYLYGSELGTAYHDVLYRMDFTACCDEAGQAAYEKIKDQMDTLLIRGFMDEKAYKSIRINKLMHFLNSSLGQRSVKASGEGRLKKEQPFSMQIPASKINEEWSSDEKVLIQGIIDAYFIEDDGIVLYDYKTDKSMDPVYYAEHYEVQLELYKEALERATGLKVKETFIYAFTPEQEILVDGKTT